MKLLKIIMLLLSITFLAQAQQPVVSGKTKLNINFEKYRTFTWAQAISQNELIKTSVKQELQAKGYQQGDDNADLVISYQVLERKTRVKGFINDNPTMVGGEEVRETQDTTTYTLEPGTLMVSLIDRKSSEVVWDGFASGVVKGSSFISDEAKVKEIVHLIFEEFKHRAAPIEN